jgi:nuclear pore complex protein Nup53
MSMSVDPLSNTTSPSHPPVGTPSNAGTPAFSTPIKLAPSTSAFKRSGSKTSTPQGHAQGQNQLQRGWGPKMPGVSASASAPVIGGSPAAAGAGVGTPSKGMLGQVSDLIFGW